MRKNLMVTDKKEHEYMVSVCIKTTCKRDRSSLSILLLTEKVIIDEIERKKNID